MGRSARLLVNRFVGPCVMVSPPNWAGVVSAEDSPGGDCMRQLAIIFLSSRTVFKLKYLGAPMRKVFVGVIAAAFAALSFSAFAAAPTTKAECDKLATKTAEQKAACDKIK